MAHQKGGSVAETLAYMLAGHLGKRKLREGMIDGIAEIVQSIQNGPIHIKENGLILHQMRMPRFFASKLSSSRKSG